MVQFMYTFDYEYPKECGKNPVFDAQLYHLADMYTMDGLKAWAKIKYSTSAGPKANRWDVWEDMGVAAYMDSVAIVYSTTPSGDRGLRDVVIRVWHDNFEHLAQRKIFTTRLKDLEDFTIDLVASFAAEKRKSSFMCTRCPCKGRVQMIQGDFQRCPHCGRQTVAGQVESGLPIPPTAGHGGNSPPPGVIFEGGGGGW
jgi:hypothetical protein